LTLASLKIENAIFDFQGWHVDVTYCTNVKSGLWKAGQTENNISKEFPSNFTFLYFIQKLVKYYLHIHSGVVFNIIPLILKLKTS
jgi:hypothetical protein